MAKAKVAFLISHPIQYVSPLFCALTDNPYFDLEVLYCSDNQTKNRYDPGFDQKVKWNIPLFKGYHYRILRNNSPCSSIYNAPFGLMNLEIIKVLKEKNYQAIIIHGWHYITHFLAISSSHKFDIPVFLRSEMPLNQELQKPAWKRKIKKYYLSQLFKKIDGFLAIGKENKKFYKYYGVSDKKIFMTKYSVENKRFFKKEKLDTSSKKEKRKNLGLPQDKLIILFSGKLIKKKNPLDLLKAAKMLNSENLAFVFIGDGPEKNALKEYIRKNNMRHIYFLGFINQKKIPDYYNVADIFVLPSGIGETWGLVVNEAMCAGLPCIVSDLPGSQFDLIEQGKTGMVFKTGNTEELASSIHTLSENQELRQHMGKNAQEMIQKWDIQDSAEAIIKAIKLNLKNYD